MTRSAVWTEGRIIRAIARQTLAAKCVVLVPNCSWTGHECDVLGVTTDLRIIDVEVKISRGDLKADARKDKWWHRTFRGFAPDRDVRDAGGRLLRVEREAQWHNAPRTWPPKVWKHYYAMPRDLWDAALFDALPSPASGVLLISEQRSAATPLVVQCVRRATPDREAYRLTPAQAVDVARLANLRMWDMAAERDQEDVRCLT